MKHFCPPRHWIPNLRSTGCNHRWSPVGRSTHPDAANLPFVCMPFFRHLSLLLPPSEMALSHTPRVKRARLLWELPWSSSFPLTVYFCDHDREYPSAHVAVLKEVEPKGCACVSLKSCNWLVRMMWVGLSSQEKPARTCSWKCKFWCIPNCRHFFFQYKSTNVFPVYPTFKLVLGVLHFL